MKRFFDTELWIKEWYRKLSAIEKGAWEYLTSNCDNVGVIRVDRELANFLIGGEVDWDSLPPKVNGNLILLPNGKFWLIDFCEFQYGELQQDCRPHASYICLLKKHGLLSLFLKTNKGYGYPINRVQDKIRLGSDKEQDKKEQRVAEPFAELKEKFSGKRKHSAQKAEKKTAAPDPF